MSVGVIGFMGLEIPILAHRISRGIFLYQFTVSSRENGYSQHYAEKGNRHPP